MAVIAAVIVALAVIGTAVGVVVATRGSAKLRPISGRPPGYQLVYRVTTSASGGGPTVTWEVLTVRRPFASSDVVYGADPATGPSPPRSATWFDADGLYTLDGSGTIRRVAGRQPGPSGSDQALGVELDALGARGLARASGGSRTVAGRTCQVVRFLEPPVGAIRPLQGRDHDDLCVDDAGLVLSERWTLHGRLVLERDAVRVRLGQVDDPVPLVGAKPLPGAGAVPTARPGADPDAPVAAPPAPTGYTLARTEIFTLPAPSGQGLQARSTVWAFTRGADAITVEAGTEQGGHYPWDGQPTRTAALDLHGLGPATTALRSDGPEIRVPLGGGRWVRVRGTVPLGVLVSFSQRLTRR